MQKEANARIGTREVRFGRGAFARRGKKLVKELFVLNDQVIALPTFDVDERAVAFKRGIDLCDVAAQRALRDIEELGHARGRCKARAPHCFENRM